MTPNGINGTASVGAGQFDLDAIHASESDDAYVGWLIVLDTGAYAFITGYHSEMNNIDATWAEFPGSGNPGYTLYPPPVGVATPANVANAATSVVNSILAGISAQHGGGDYAGGSLTEDEHAWLSALNSARINGDLTISNVGPVLRPQQMALIRGDEYSTATGQAIIFELTELEGLTITTPVFRLQRKRGHQVIQGTAVVAGDPPTVSVTLTSEQTATLSTGPKTYEFALTVLVNGERRTMRHGEVTVDADIPAP